jgi:hypothetical protein
MAERSTGDALAIAGRYRSISALVPPDEARAQAALALLHGLTKVDDETRRTYLAGFGEMLARVDARTCAAIARDEIGFDEMKIALTYIQYGMHGFLRAADAAVTAGSDGKPAPVLDKEAAIKAAQQFIGTLKPEDQERYGRLVTSTDKMSAEDECWRARVDYSRPATLAEADANTWGTIVAATAFRRVMPGQPIPDQANVTPPPAPPDHRRDNRSNRPPSPDVNPRPPVTPARVVPPAPPARPVVLTRTEPSLPRTPVANDTETGGAGSDLAGARPTAAIGHDESPGNVATVATTPPPVAAGGLPSSPHLTYARMLDVTMGALRAGRNAEAGELIDRLIQTDPSRSEGWVLRGVMAMTVYNNLPAAYEAYQIALSRGGAAAFRLLHDHGPDQTPCGGTFTIASASIQFDGGPGGHRFQWPLAAIREAAINDFYGSNFGMFHIKVQTLDGSKNFNFAVLRPNDLQIVNRRADADMLLRLVNQRRLAAAQ